MILFSPSNKLKADQALQYFPLFLCKENTVGIGVNNFHLIAFQMHGNSVPTSPPWSSIGLVPCLVQCVSAYTLSSPAHGNSVIQAMI